MIKNAYGYLHARQTLMVAVMVAASCVTLRAQPDGPGGPPPDDLQPQLSSGPSVEHQLKKLTRLLTLTSDQRTQVKTILADQHQQMQALLKQSKPAKESDNASADNGFEPNSAETTRATRAALKAIREAADAKISELLTASQQTKFAAWKEKQEKAADREDDDMPPPPPDVGGGPPGV